MAYTAVPLEDTDTLYQGKEKLNSNLEALEDELKYEEIRCLFRGGSQDIAVGEGDWIQASFAGGIIEWALQGDGTGSIQIQVRKCSSGNFPPGSGNTICAGHEPALVNQRSASSSDLSGWSSTSFIEGDYLGFAVLSCTGQKKVNLKLKIQKG